MAILNHLLLFCSLVPLALSYPFFPPTCYTKVLTMARELTQWAADLKRDPGTVSYGFKLSQERFKSQALLHLLNVLLIYNKSICTFVQQLSASVI